MHTDLDNMTAPELAAELKRLQSNHANRVRESLARREALARDRPNLFVCTPNTIIEGQQELELEKVLAELNADIVAAEKQDAERMDALIAVLLARITAPLQ